VFLLQLTDACLLLHAHSLLDHVDVFCSESTAPLPGGGVHLGRSKFQFVFDVLEVLAERLYFGLLALNQFRLPALVGVPHAFEFVGGNAFVALDFLQNSL